MNRNITAELLKHNQQFLAAIPTACKRYNNVGVDWQQSAIAIFGARGIGKTTLICQFLLDKYKSTAKVLYIAADSVSTAALGLFSIASNFFNAGGEAVFIDNADKLPHCQQQLQQIVNRYGNKKVIIASNQQIVNDDEKQLNRFKHYHLHGISFREYIKITDKIELPILSIDKILHDHGKISGDLHGFNMLQHFSSYLHHGYYPHFLRDSNSSIFEVNSIIERTTTEDIMLNFNLKHSTLNVLKKLLHAIANSNGFNPNIDELSRQLQTSRDVIYNCLEYLHLSGLTNNLFYNDNKNKSIRKPEKVWLDNTSMFKVLISSNDKNHKSCNASTTFFVNQVQAAHNLQLHDDDSFIVNNQHLIEVGCKGCNLNKEKQSDFYFAVDKVAIGFGKKIPLYLFGMLY